MSRVLEVELDTASAITGLGAQTVAALPPSAADAAAGRIRVRVNGVESLRRYDAELEQP